MILITGLAIATAQPVSGATITTSFLEVFNGLQDDTDNGAHTPARAGDFIGVDTTNQFGPGTALVNGWMANGTGTHFHVVNNPDGRAGAAGSHGLGNNYDGCPTPLGCGAAHTNTVTAGTDVVIFTLLARRAFDSSQTFSSGLGNIYLGDSTLTSAVAPTGGVYNAYEVTIDPSGGLTETNNGTFATLSGGTGSSTAYTNVPGSDFYEIKIAVTNVGTIAESAELSVDGVVKGTFPPSGGAFDLTHVAVRSLNEDGIGGGQTTRIYDNIEVISIDFPPPPPPPPGTLISFE